MTNTAPVIISLLALGVSGIALWGQIQSSSETNEREQLVAQINACVALSQHHYSPRVGNDGGPWANKTRALALCLSSPDPAACRIEVNRSDDKDLC